MITLGVNLEETGVSVTTRREKGALTISVAGISPRVVIGDMGTKRGVWRKGEGT